MTDKEFAVVKERVGKIAKEWIYRLGLNWYKVDILYKMGDAPQSYTGSGIAPFNVITSWQYRCATINVYVEDLPKDDEELEHAIVHELCHIFVHPMRGNDWDQDKEEYTVESLTRAFLWVNEGVKRNAKK